MSITSSFQNICIRAADAGLNVWHLTEDVGQASEDSWDTWSGAYTLFATAGKSKEELLEDWPVGKKLGDSNLWVTARRPLVLASGIYKMQIEAKGLLEARGYKVNYRSFANKQSPTNPVTISGVGTYPKATVSESDIAATYTTILLDESPPTENVGEAMEAPWGSETAVFPEHRASNWETLIDPHFHFPNGWVFEDLEAEGLIAPEGMVSGVWLVRMGFRFVHAFTPS